MSGAIDDEAPALLEPEPEIATLFAAQLAEAGAPLPWTIQSNGSLTAANGRLVALCPPDLATIVPWSVMAGVNVAGGYRHAAAAQLARAPVEDDDNPLARAPRPDGCPVGYVADFVAECLQQDERAYLTAAQIRRAYEGWCARRHVEAIPYPAYGQKLTDSGVRATPCGFMGRLLGYRWRLRAPDLRVLPS